MCYVPACTHKTDNLCDAHENFFASKSFIACDTHILIMHVMHTTRITLVADVYHKSYWLHTDVIICTYNPAHNYIILCP